MTKRFMIACVKIIIVENKKFQTDSVRIDDVFRRKGVSKQFKMHFVIFCEMQNN